MTRKTTLHLTLFVPFLSGAGLAACGESTDPPGTTSGPDAGTVGTTGNTGNTVTGSTGTPTSSGNTGSTVAGSTGSTVTSGNTGSTVSSSTTGTSTGTTAGTMTGVGGATTTGSATSAGGANNTGGATNTTDSTSTTGGQTVAERPCDVYQAGGTPCVAAYSTIRRLSSAYTGPLYQVRSGSNAMNTGSGGELHDIGQNADGYADAAAQDAVCANTICTISLMYDHSGNGNDLPVAKRGRSDGGEWADDDDFESIADEDERMVGGHRVYTLYMEARQGYRQTSPGTGMPLDQEPQGIYMLADGTHYGTACCWDFGNVTPDPTQYHTMNTLFFGVAFWGRGAGNGPWYMADFEAGVWAGGSNPSDPGWGSLDTNAPPNQNNPSLGVPFAIGFLKTDSDYALRMADLATASQLTTAYEGPLPKPMDNQGAVVIGVGGDNSNNSWGTFYEGAIVAGYPSDATEDAVMQNVKAAGYGQ